jgi:histidine ammonia-lyase
VTYLVSTVADVDLDAVRRVAWGGESARLSAAALDAVTRRRREFETFVEANTDRHLYGITTRQGSAAGTLLDDAARREFGRRLPTTPPALGPGLPERVARGVVLARLSDVLHGTAALRRSTVERLTKLLDEPLPTIPEAGNGEPGDIIVLGQLFRPTFEGTLDVGEGMALVNGSPVASAVLADAVLLAEDRMPRLEMVLALAAVAAHLPDMHLDAELGRLWGDPHQREALARYRELLEGGDWPRRAYQAQVSFRGGPRVVGGLRRTLTHAREAAVIALAAASNNPAYIGPEVLPPLGAVLSNAGYHNPLVAPTIDTVTHAWADLAQLVNAQINRLVEEPEGIAAYEPEPLIGSFPMSASGWAEEARAAAQPSLIGLGRSGQTDTSTPDVLAWRRTVDAGNALDALLALLAVTAVHLVEHRGETFPPRLQGLRATVLDVFARDTPPIRFADAIGAVQGQLKGLSR